MLRFFPKASKRLFFWLYFSRSLLGTLTDIIYREGLVLLQRINFSKRIWILILCHRAKSLSPDFPCRGNRTVSSFRCHTTEGPGRCCFHSGSRWIGAHILHLILTELHQDSSHSESNTPWSSVAQANLGIPTELYFVMTTVGMCVLGVTSAAGNLIPSRWWRVAVHLQCGECTNFQV